MLGWFEATNVTLKMLKSYPQLPIDSLAYGFNAFHESLH